MATMADVARLAGVSTTTVSHVINRTRPVSDAAVHRVHEAMRITGYRQNLTARALATQSTATVGLAMSAVTNPYFADLVRDIEQRLRAAGYTLVLSDTNDSPDVEVDVINHLLARRVDGLIVMPIEGSAALNEFLNALLEDRLPLVCIDRPSALPVDQVYSECSDSTFLLTAHLAEQGHRRIGFVRGASTSATSSERLGGYLRAVRELGLVEEAAMVVAGDSDEVATEVNIYRHFTETPRPATALVVSNNQMTIGALRALKRLGLRVPTDVALVCYDDFEWADLFEPALTAVAQDTPRLATRVVDLLLERLKNPTRPPESVIIPTTFVHRDSCGCGADGANDHEARR